MSPAGLEINTNGEDVALKLKKNLYRLKDVGRTWWEYLSAGLDKMGFKQYIANQCVWKKDAIVIIVYVDDCLVFANNRATPMAKNVIEKHRQKNTSKALTN
eukprot:10441498-Ditylum_brightwellii.AAC.1